MTIESLDKILSAKYGFSSTSRCESDGFWTDTGRENSEICENNFTKNVQ